MIPGRRTLKYDSRSFQFLGFDSDSAIQRRESCDGCRKRYGGIRSPTKSKPTTSWTQTVQQRLQLTVPHHPIEIDIVSSIHSILSRVADDEISHDGVVL